MFIIDNFLKEEIRLKLLNQVYSDPSMMNFSWEYFNFTDIDNNSIKSIFVNKASNFFDLKNMVGIESWGNANALPNFDIKMKSDVCDIEVSGWHYDIDENLFKSKNIQSFPICSLVYYLEIDDLVGGSFLTKTEKIKPITNRLILFGPKVLHAVEPFDGTRIPLLMALWDYDITDNDICDHIVIN